VLLDYKKKDIFFLKKIKVYFCKAGGGKFFINDRMSVLFAKPYFTNTLLTHKEISVNPK
jgi:hypothetical protein